MHEMLLAATDTALRGKNKQNSDGAARNQKKKTSKTKQFFLMYLSTHSLSLSLSLSLIAPPSVVVGKNLSARNAAKTLSQRKQVPESKKKNTQFAQVLGRKKNSTLSQLSLNSLSLSFSFVF